MGAKLANRLTRSSGWARIQSTAMVLRFAWSASLKTLLGLHAALEPANPASSTAMPGPTPPGVWASSHARSSARLLMQCAAGGHEVVVHVDGLTDWYMCTDTVSRFRRKLGSTL